MGESDISNNDGAKFLCERGWLKKATARVDKFVARYKPPLRRWPRTKAAQDHMMRGHLRNDGTACGYTTPPVGDQCRKCGCVIGKTKADDVIYVRPEDRPPPTSNQLILRDLDDALKAIAHAGAALDPAGTLTPKLAQAGSLVREVQRTVKRRKTK